MGQPGHVTICVAEWGKNTRCNGETVPSGKEKLLLDEMDRVLGRQVDRMFPPDVETLHSSIQDTFTEHFLSV